MQVNTQSNEEWREATRRRVREAFDLFDKEKTNSVIQEEVSTIMRFLGVYPTEKAIVKDILPEMQGDEPTGFVQYPRFESKMLELLASREWEMDTADVLLQAFRTIDVEGKGYVEAVQIEELLTTKGTPFRPKEVEAFLKAAKDASTSNIFYEDYVAILTSECSESSTH